MASFWYIYLYSSIIVLSQYDGVYSECDVQVSEQSITVGTNGNLTVLCDTSCMIKGNRRNIIWYDTEFNQVPQSGRIFSVSYGRGRYSRLVIINAVPTDEGTYICTLETNGGIKQKSFTLVYDGYRPVQSNVYQDIGPRRGDVVIYDPDILHPRPKRDAANDSMPSDTGSADDDGFTSTSTDAETETSSETPMATTNDNQNNLKTDTKSVLKSTTSKPPTPTPTPEPEPEPEPTSVPKSTTSKTPAPAPEPETNTQEGGNSHLPNTEFGRSGLVAFVVSLSIALLLLYALLLILLIPICLKRKKRRTDTKTKKDTPVVLSQVVKSQDKEDLPSPGPSDAGFTTIDLDDHPQNKQEDGNSQVMAVESVKSEPDAPESQNSMLNSVMSATDTEANKPTDDDLKFIDETTPDTQVQKLDDSSVFDNSTPEVVDEPQRPTTETTEVKLEITEKDDGQKQIKLSSSSPPRETQSVSSQSSN